MADSEQKRGPGRSGNRKRSLPKGRRRFAAPGAGVCPRVERDPPDGGAARVVLLLRSPKQTFHGEQSTVVIGH